MAFLNLMKNRLKPREVNEALSDIGDLPNIPTPTEVDVGKVIKVGNDGYELAEESGGSLPDYSTNEVATGQKWIDGKELYQKVIPYDIETLGLNSGTIIDTGVSDADFMFIDKYMLVLPTGSYAGTYTGEKVGSYNLNLIITTNFKIQSLSTSSNFDPGEGRKLYFIIKYTKSVSNKKKKTK